MKNNAAGNPFRVSQLESVSWIPAPEPLDAVYQNWKDHHFRGQLVGRHGSGKTTLGLFLLDKAREDGYETLHLFANDTTARSVAADWKRQIHRASENTCVLMDGLHVFLPWQRRRLIVSAKRILLTAHRPFWTIPQLVSLQMTPTLLRSLVRELAGETGLELLSDNAEEWLKRYHGNTREVLFRLYDLWSTDSSR